MRIKFDKKLVLRSNPDAGRAPVGRRSGAGSTKKFTSNNVMFVSLSFTFVHFPSCSVFTASSLDVAHLIDIQLA